MCLVENRRNFLSGNSVREGDIFLVDKDPVNIVVPNPNRLDPDICRKRKKTQIKPKNLSLGEVDVQKR
jgi:hypothetical protein